MKKYYKLLRLLPMAFIPFGGLLAQEAEEVFDLSPFEVNVDSDVGYSATSTLAGTRLNTDLRDIGASISIVNEEFLEDTASTNLMDVLLFTPNTEVSGPAGNFSGSQGFGAGNPIPEGESDRRNGGTTRIRGLAAADLTRDYFITDTPFDTYNVDRIAVQRGANSALFGIGSPGGIVNNTMIRANMYGDNGRVRFQTDEHGTARGTFRYNKVLIEDKLSFLVAGLVENRQYTQEEAFMEDERIYASLSWNITENLRFHASAEFADRHSANPDYTPPNDGITPWIESGKPITMGGADGSSLFRGTDERVLNPGYPNQRFLNVVGATSLGFVSYFNAEQVAPIWGGNNFVHWKRDAPGNYEGGRLGEMILIQTRTREDTIRRYGVHPNGAPVEAGTGGFYSTGFVNSQILDRSIFDYQKHMFNGGTYTQNSDWDIYQMSLEGTWWDNKVGFDVSSFKQDWVSDSSNPVQGTQSRAIFIDPNMYLIGTTNGEADGPLLPNPNFGKPTLAGKWGGNNLRADRESTRITAFAHLHAEDFLDEGLVSRILGHVKLTGNYQERKVRDYEAYMEDKTSPDVIVSQLEGDFALHRNTILAGAQFALPHDTGYDFLGANSIQDLAGANIGPIPFGNKRIRPVKNEPFTGWSQSQMKFVNFNGSVFDQDDGDGQPATFFAGKGLEKLESKVIVAQGHFWDDSITVMGAWRSDRLRSTSVGAPAGSGVFSRTEQFDDPTWLAGPQASNLTEDADADSASWSATWHITDMFEDLLGDGNELSIYMSESDNFQPASGRVYIDNVGIPDIVGDTEEKGIILSAKDGMFVARLNWYKTGVLNQSFDKGGVSANEGILRGLVEQLANQDNIDQGFTASDSQAVLPPQGVQDLNTFVPDWANATVTTSRNSGDNGTQDFTSEGNELEIAYNPNSNWTMMLNVAKQETITANIYPVLREYVQDFVIPNWVNSSFAQSYYINADSTQTLAERAQTSIVDPVTNALSLEGIPSVEQRKYRASFNTSYHFGRNNDMIPDFLGDFTAGGGYRWQDRGAVGFGLTQNSLGTWGQDASKPFWAPRQDFVDIFLRSKYQLSDKYDLTVQLNIKDLFDNNDLVPIFVNPDSTKLYRFLPGRLISLTGTLEF